MTTIVIAGYARSPFHFAKKGGLINLRPDDLAAQVLKGLVNKLDLDPSQLEDVIMGCAYPEAEQGMNIARIASFRATIEQDINRSVEALAGLRVPVIGRVHGACAGFGLSLALGCDMVLAADTAYFTTAYGSIALSGDGGVSWFLPRIVGRHKAFELLLMAERFDAAEALRLGVANKVVPLAQLDAAVDALVGRILRGPKEAYAEMKRLLNQSPDQSLDAQLQLEAEAFARCAARPDFDEGVGAFLEKRKPKFNG